MRRVKTGFLISVIALLTYLGACNSTKLATIPDDSAIKNNIQSRLFQDALLKTRDVQVDSQKGVVSLSGTVSSDIEKLAVEGLARGVAGVTQVVNQLSVSPSPISQTVSPAATTPSKPVAARPRKLKNAPQESKSPDTHFQETSEAPQPAPAPSGPIVNPIDTAIAQEPPAPSVHPASPPPPVEVTVPSGTVITIRMIDSIDSSRNQSGQEFAASLEVPIVVGDTVVIQRGADARVRLANVSSAGHVQGRSELQLELISISAHGMIYPVETADYRKQGASRGKQTGATIGGAAGLGALIGAAAGGGKGAAIGAAIGVAGGGVATAATNGQQVRIASETKLDFTLKSPMTVTMNHPIAPAESATN
ncbi:MAG TPA: BON domain-containing protein [Terriglobia bacterium]|nr:BON domain-containing protein [Terriglobia bacterium]